MKFSDYILQHTVSDEVNIIPVLGLEGENELGESELPDTLPIIALRNAVLFPETIIPITVGREKSIKLVREAYKGNKILGAVTQKDAKLEDPRPQDLYDIGTLAKIIKIIEMPDGGLTIILQGMKRFHILDLISTNPYFIASVKYIDEDKKPKSTKELDAITGSVKDLALQIIKLSPHLPQEASFAIKNIEGYSFLINFISSSMELDNISDKIALLRENKIKERALKLLEILNRQIDMLKLKDDIQQKVRTEIDQQQREYYLNSQLKTIQEELGMNNNVQEFGEIRQKALSKLWPKSVQEVFEKEIQRLERSNPNSPDFNVQLSYVRFLVELPWSETTKDNLDLKHAQKVLDQDHFGLETVKERIIEHLAVLKLKGDMKSPILCLHGPPGVGKTSLGKSIAKALGRHYGRISLGGLHDESEIRGHRRTYVGALPGRMIQGIKTAGTNNPVFMLDEIDKIAGRESGHGPDVSREGVQRDLLPIVEGSTVNTKYGMIKTDHILFIASGAFHLARPSDLVPELQGRFPIRVELKALTADDFVRILTEPNASLTEQYTELLRTENYGISFKADGIKRLAEIAFNVNEKSENIGARRLHTILERLLENISFEASEKPGESVEIDKAYVNLQLEKLAEDEDLSRYIL